MLAQFALIACILLQIMARSWAQQFFGNVSSAVERGRYYEILRSETLTKQECDNALKKWAADNGITVILVPETGHETRK